MYNNKTATELSPHFLHSIRPLQCVVVAIMRKLHKSGKCLKHMGEVTVQAHYMQKSPLTLLALPQSSMSLEIVGAQFVYAHVIQHTLS